MTIERISAFRVTCDRKGCGKQEDFIEESFPTWRATNTRTGRSFDFQLCSECRAEWERTGQPPELRQQEEQK